MEEYRQWLEQQIERSLNDKDLQREHWAFCKAYEKFTALRQPPVSGWVAVTDTLPKPLQTVWLTNGKGWVCLGCLVESDGGWHWAESNGVIYIKNGEIVSECESEDLDVNFWHELPKPLCH